MGKNIFRIFNPGGLKEDPKDKRRAQLRRAQQTYRERKDSYTRNLEKELGRTRANEARLMRRCEGLEASVKALVRLLPQHGIDLPIDLSAPNACGSASYLQKEGSQSCRTASVSSPCEGADVGMAGMNGQKESLVDEWVVEDAAAVLWTAQGPSTDYHSPGESWPSSTQQYESEQPYTPASNDLAVTNAREIPVGRSVGFGELDAITLGMEFVLTVEEPCLGHIHGDPAKPDEPNGHGLTTTSQLFHVCEPSPLHHAPSSSRPLYKSAPEAMLVRLLSLSPDLSSDGELTPIQAWNDILCGPYSGNIDSQSLRALGEKLRAAVKCHGFGAVVQRAKFEEVVYETLVVGRVFQTTV